MKRIRSRYVALWHLLLSAFVFSDFFLKGKILVSSLDIIDFQLPAWELARRSFLSGHLGLWNPYLLNGISLFSMGLTPILYPENWILFLLPEKTFFLGITFLAFLKLWFIGYFGFLWFRKELRHRGWALFASTSYQLCGFALWAVSNSNLLTLSCYMTLTLYLIWTTDERSKLKNFIFVTLVASQLFYSANLTYEVYAVALVILFSLYRNWQSKEKIGLLALSGVVCVLLAMPRWLPSWYEIQNSTRVSDHFSSTFVSLGFLVTRLFVPETFGVSFWDSFNVIKQLSPLYETWGIQIHSHFPQFFGVITALLVLVGWLTGSFDRRANFWGVFTLFVLSSLLWLEPLSTAFKGLIFPLYHHQSLQIWLPATFVLFAAYVGRSLERSVVSLQARLGTFRILFSLVGISVLTVWSIAFQPSSWIHWAWKILAFLFLIRFSANWFWGLALGGVLMLQSSPAPFHLSHLREMGVSLIALSILSKRLNLRMTPFLLSGVFLTALFFSADYPMHELATQSQSAVLAGAGLIKFLLIGFFFLKLVESHRKWLLPGCLLLLILDLVPMAKVHSHLVMNPFWKGATPFPGKSLKLDLVNYRVGSPNTFASPPLYSELYGRSEILSSIFSVYGIRSYAGCNNLVSNRYDKFLKEMLPGYPENFRELGKRGLIGNVTDDRFLDLTGVRYDFDPSRGTLFERPNALSRFALFSSFEVSASPDRLKTVAIQETLLLEKSPGISPGINWKNFPLHAHESGESLELDVTGPGILLFNDSFHPGWVATLNGKAVEVLRANLNFMAVPIPPGRASITFRFDPPYFSLGKNLAYLGMFGFLISCLGLAIQPWRFRTRLFSPIPVPST